VGTLRECRYANTADGALARASGNPDPLRRRPLAAACSAWLAVFIRGKADHDQLGALATGVQYESERKGSMPTTRTTATFATSGSRAGSLA